jgi:hypothetical protein
MRKFLTIIIILAFIGCATTIPYGPVTNSDQRILFEGLGFYPPSGENWKIRSQPLGGYYSHEKFGRALGKIWPFKKIIAGQDQTSGKEETVFVAVFKHEFVLMSFDHDDDLMEFAQESFWARNEQARPEFVDESSDFYRWWLGKAKADKKGDLIVLESNLFLEKFKGMNCVKRVSKEQESDRWEQGVWMRDIIYTQGYSCVHPSHPNHIIQFYAAQKVLENQTPTDIQNELNYFFNSLKVDACDPGTESCD